MKKRTKLKDTFNMCNLVFSKQNYILYHKIIICLYIHIFLNICTCKEKITLIRKIICECLALFCILLFFAGLWYLLEFICFRHLQENVADYIMYLVFSLFIINDFYIYKEKFIKQIDDV